MLVVFSVLFGWPNLLRLQSSLHWHMVWNGVTLILKLSIFNQPFFLLNSQSALVFLSVALAFLQSESFWDNWALSDFLSFRTALRFQWVPGHAGLHGIELADSLAKTESELLFADVPSQLAPVISKIRRTCYCTPLGDEIFLTIISFAIFLRFP